MLSFIFGFFLGGLFVYWVVTDTDKNVKHQAAKPLKSSVDKDQSKPVLDLPYFKYKHIRPPSEREWYKPGTYGKLGVCPHCYRTSHNMTDGWPGTCPDCGTKYPTGADISGKWISSVGKWVLGPTSPNPYPVPRQYEQAPEKDITPQQKKLQDNS